MVVHFLPFYLQFYLRLSTYRVNTWEHVYLHLNFKCIYLWKAAPVCAFSPLSIPPSSPTFWPELLKFWPARYSGEARTNISGMQHFGKHVNHPPFVFRDKHIIKLTSWRLTLIRLVLLSHDIIDKGGTSHCGNLVIVGSQLWSQSCEGGTASLPLGCHRGCHRVPLACHWGATGFSMDLLREQQAMHWASTERVT